MLSESKSKILIVIFSIGLLLSCLFFTKLVIDITLVPRFLLLSLFLFSYFFLLIFFKRKIEVKYNFFTLLYFVFLLYGIFSLLWAFNFSLSIVEISKIFSFFIFFIFCQFYLQTNEKFFKAKILKTVIILFFISILPFIQEIVDIGEFSRYKLYEISAISGHKNLYSSFVFLCLVFSFFGFYIFVKKWKIIALFAIICQLSIIFILQTRSVYIAAVISVLSFLLVYFLRSKLIVKNVKLICLLILITVILLNMFFIIIFPKVINYYLDNKIVKLDKEIIKYEEVKILNLTSFTERILIWQKTNEIIQDNFFWGVGANNWQIFFPCNTLPKIYRLTDLNVTFQRPHNDFLWRLSEFGIIGFNIYYIFVISILFFLIFIAKFEIANIILFSGIVGYLCFSFFDFPMERIEHNLLFNTLLSISVFNITKSVPIFEKKIYISNKIVILGSFILGFILFVAFLNFKGEFLTKQIYIEKIAKNNKKIIVLCNKAVSFCYSLDATSMPICWYRGNANANLGNYDRAFYDFKIAYKHHPYNQYVLNDLASAYYMKNLSDSAKFYYLEAIRINPRFNEPKFNLTAIYINEENYIEAKRWNEAAISDSFRRDYFKKIIEKFTEPN